MAAGVFRQNTTKTFDDLQRDDLLKPVHSDVAALSLLEPKETEPMAYLQTNVVYTNKKRSRVGRYHELKALLVLWKETFTSRT